MCGMRAEGPTLSAASDTRPQPSLLCDRARISYKTVRSFDSFREVRLKQPVWVCVASLAWIVVTACNSDDPSAHSEDDAGQADAGVAGAGAGAETGHAGGASGMDAAGTGGDSGDAGGASGMDGAGGDNELIPLPGDSRIYADVFNLVDAEAEAQLLGYLELKVQELTLPAQRFYEVFPDAYDFLFFITDRETGGVSAALDSVRRQAIPGTGVAEHTPMLDYYSTERLRSVVGVQRSPGSFPPLAHELAHNWANFLDRSLGFGRHGDGQVGAHWGLTSVFGQLGGFDGSTLRCETPKGAMPPDCMPLASGRFRYVLGYFDPYTNSSQRVAYAPLELYLMGLTPLSEVPESFMVLTDGAIDPASFDDADGNNTLIVEASGVGEIRMADVVAIHGERVPATEEDKHFSSAFVVVSATPASDEVMAEVDSWAAIFGDRMPHNTWWSFARYTGGRATLDTRLGPRRAIDDPLVIPQPPEPIRCDLLLQDCEAGMGCYFGTTAMCGTAGSLQAGEPCVSDSDCALGNACSFGASRLCAPYCDPLDAGSAQACATLCPGAFVELTDEDAVDVGAMCLAGAGGPCDPLDPQCAAGSACYGTDTTGCRPEGSSAAGQACSGLGNECAAGTTCVGIQGGAGRSCQPYCDPAATASIENACATLCPGKYWTFDAYGVCIPDA